MRWKVLHLACSKDLGKELGWVQMKEESMASAMAELKVSWMV